MYGIGRDVGARDVSAERSILSLIGPAARDHLDVAPPDREHAFVEGEHGLYVATDLGVDVIAPADSVGGLHGALGVEPVSLETAECLRIESGRPRLGVDMDDTTIPQEAGLNERAVSFDKGCYVGQETVARLHYRGKPNRHLRGLRLSAPANTGDAVRAGDREVGARGVELRLSRARADRAGPASPGGGARRHGVGRTRRERGRGGRASVRQPVLTGGSRHGRANLGRVTNGQGRRSVLRPTAWLRSRRFAVRAALRDSGRPVSSRSVQREIDHDLVTTAARRRLRIARLGIGFRRDV